MSFPLRPDVGDDVLASFASIAVPDSDAPPLPPANHDDRADWPLGSDPECDMSDPWSHDWGAWLGAQSTVNFIESDQGATMVWRRHHWVVTCRATWELPPKKCVKNLAVLGTLVSVRFIPAYADMAGYTNPSRTGEAMTGLLVGYVRHEITPPRPWLLWADGSTLRAEDLNPRRRGDPRIWPAGDTAIPELLMKQVEQVGRRVFVVPPPSASAPDGNEAVDDGGRVVEEAIRRTLDSPQLYFVLYSVLSEDSGSSWSGSKVCGWWARDGAELFAETADRRGQESFGPNWKYVNPTEEAWCSLIRGPQRHTWRRTRRRVDLGMTAQKSCLQRIDDAPDTPRELVETWRTAQSGNDARGVGEETIPPPATTPMEILAALLADGFELVDIPAEHQRPNLHAIRFRGSLTESPWQSHIGLWRGSLWLDDEGFVIGVRLRADDHTWTFSLGHGDEFERPKVVVPTYVPVPIELDDILSVGKEVLMPPHRFQIEAEAGDPESYTDFSIIVAGDDTEAITTALANVAPRIMWLTYFGRELTAAAEHELIRELEIYTPNYVGDPHPEDNGISIYSDWKSEVGPRAANACLALVVQELLAAGVTDARLSKPT